MLTGRVCRISRQHCTKSDEAHLYKPKQKQVTQMVYVSNCENVFVSDYEVIYQNESFDLSLCKRTAELLPFVVGNSPLECLRKFVCNFNKCYCKRVGGVGFLINVVFIEISW